MSPSQDRGGRRAAALPAAPSSRRRASWSASSRPPQRAREEGWPYEQFLEDAAARPRSSRATPPAPASASATPRFPAHKTLEDFDFTAQPGAEKPLILHLAQLAWIAEHTQRLLLRAARHRQDPPRDRAGDQGLPGRPPRRVRHRPAMGRPPRARPAPQRARRRTPPPRALPAARRRRDRLPAPGTPGRQPALRARRPPLRTRLDHRHQQPRLRGLGRDPRRRHGRRRPHRPPRPPRPHGHPQRQELPPPRTRHRGAPAAAIQPAGLRPPA